LKRFFWQHGLTVIRRPYSETTEMGNDSVWKRRVMS